MNQKTFAIIIILFITGCTTVNQADNSIEGYNIRPSHQNEILPGAPYIKEGMTVLMQIENLQSSVKTETNAFKIQQAGWQKNLKKHKDIVITNITENGVRVMDEGEPAIGAVSADYA